MILLSPAHLIFSHILIFSQQLRHTTNILNLTFPHDLLKYFDAILLTLTTGLNEMLLQLYSI